MEKLFPQRLLHGVLTVILAVGGTVAIASEAEAAPYCPSGATCLWRDVNRAHLINKGESCTCTQG